MELGLSLGDAASKPVGFLAKSSTSDKQHTTLTNKNGLLFCMTLGLNSFVGNQDSEKAQKSDESHDDLAHTSEERDGLDDHQKKFMETPVPLDLLPLACPVPPHSIGSSENGSLGHVGLLPARGFGVNRLPATAGGAAEEVSSANSVGSPFPMDFGLSTNTGKEKMGGNKRNIYATRHDIAYGERASSRASDEDKNINNKKKLRLSKEQSAHLEDNFTEHNTLNPKRKLALAKQLNLRPRQIEVWFQNRRARTKLKQTEVDCEYMKRCCETLTEENRRLHKELQELRALKSSNPFHMQLPATTLTMCPSCERVATTTSAATNTAAANLTIAQTSSYESTPKALVQFPLSRQRFHPFSFSPTHSHQSAAS